jgi:general secretion pathway protein A
LKRQALGQDPPRARPHGTIATTSQSQVETDDRKDKLQVVAPPIVSAPEVVTRSQAPSLITSRPPIRIEEGLVEVGWEGDMESEFGPTDMAVSGSEAVSSGDPPLNEEPIEDRYAELQAWTEWSKSQECVALPSDGSQVSFPPDTHEPSQGPAASPLEPPRELRQPSPATAPPGVRAEPQQEFAPYSQLFTRLRQSKQP